VSIGTDNEASRPDFDRFAYARPEDCLHDVFVFERGNERLLDICEERLSAHNAINHTRHRHPIPAQAGYEPKGFPVFLRYAAE
jgi:hypothetical protein